MIHPNYKGSDGELLWHVYYGDFSNDERFDAFRKNELWDADVIRPIIEEDLLFAEYQQGKTYNKAQAKVLAHESGRSVGESKRSSSGGHLALWVVVMLAAVAGAVAYWYKYKRGDSKLFNQVEAKSLLNRKSENEVYVY